MKVTEFKNKKVVILGLGMEGMDVCRYLSASGAKITFFDQKEKDDLKELVREGRKLGAAFKLGRNYLKGGLLDFDFVFRSPGFYRFLPEITAVQKGGAVISSATKLFFEQCPAKIIGITGTKGKGTTATLIYEILKNSGKRVFLAGNIGQPMLALLEKLQIDDWVVLELSSFQLIDLQKSPHIAVVLNIAVDHLDWHKDKNEYIAAKANLVSHQGTEDFAVINADYPVSFDFGQKTKGKVFYVSRQKKVKGSYAQGGEVFLNITQEQKITDTDKLQLRGEHNLENITAACLAAHLAGASFNSLQETAVGFVGLEHRLEFVGEFEGIKYYNDSFSTTPETCIAAIKSFSEPLILIAGGSEKGSDFMQLGEEISKSNIKTLILIGLMTERIKEAVEKVGRFRGKIITDLVNMEQIIKTAKKEAKAGDVVLLSPACASFDMFTNYKERGEQFKNWVKKLA